MTAATSQKLSIPSSPAMGEALQKPDRPVVVPTLEQKAPAAGKPEPNRRVIVLPIVGVLLVLAALWYGYGWLTTGRFMVTTDDSYVRADVSQLGSKIAGYVAVLPIANNTRVAAGDLIAKIDDGDFLVALDAARTKSDTQRATIQRLQAQVAVQDQVIAQNTAQLESARADAVRAAADNQRYEALGVRNVVAQQKIEQARADKDRTAAAVDGAKATLLGAHAQKDVLAAQIDEAKRTLAEFEVQVRKAERDLAATEIRAPVAGIFGNRSAELGAYLPAGGRIGALVATSSLYIEANFKETQIARLTPGQIVTISVDADSRHAVRGRVESLAPASGATFSLLPPENATGNFTKIVQRLPVRIRLEETVDATTLLRPGLSVIVSVDTRALNAPPAATAAAR